MKLNPDCIRDVLLYLEENLIYVHTDANDLTINHNSISIYKIAQEVQNINNHDYDDVLYAIEKLMEKEFIVPDKISKGNGNKILVCSIKDISYDGHNFLNTVRSQNIWDATVSAAKKIGSVSIHTLTTLAMEIMKSLATNPTLIQNIVQSMQ